MAERDRADRLRCVSEGEKDYALLCASEFDAVIGDIQMQGISGYELCLEIEAHPAAR